MKSATTALLSLALLLPTGCARPSDDGDHATTPGFRTSPTQELPAGEVSLDRLYGHTFTARSVTGDAATEDVMAGVPFTVKFNGVGTMGVRANCNTLGVEVSIDGGMANLDIYSTTRKACEAAHASQDEWLTGFFGSSPQQWTWDGSALVLTYQDSAVTLTETEERPGEGTSPS